MSTDIVTLQGDNKKNKRRNMSHIATSSSDRGQRPHRLSPVNAVRTCAKNELNAEIK